MEGFLKDLFATADENELAEFDKELESIINSCPDTDENIISAVQEKAKTEGDPIKEQPAANVKIKSLLPAVIAAVLAFALFAGLFSRIETRNRVSPQPGKAVSDSSESDSAYPDSSDADSSDSDSPPDSDELAYYEELSYADKQAMNIALMVDDFIADVKEGKIKTLRIPLGYITADLSDPEDEGRLLLESMAQLLAKPAAVTDDGTATEWYSEYTVPDEGEAVIKISQELFVVGVQWRNDPDRDTPIGSFTFNAYPETVDMSEFGKIEVNETLSYQKQKNIINPETYFDTDAEYYTTDEIGNILRGGSGEGAVDEYLKKNVELMSKFGVSGKYIPTTKTAFPSLRGNRIDTWLAGYSKSYPYLTLYIAAKTNDSLPFDYEGIGEETLESDFNICINDDKAIQSGRIRWFSDGQYAVTRLQIEIPSDSFEEMVGQKLLVCIFDFEYGDSYPYYESCIASNFVFLDKEPPQGDTSILLSGGDDYFGGDGSTPGTQEMTYGYGFDDNEELTELVDNYLKEIADNYDPEPLHYYDSKPSTYNFIQVYRNGLMLTIPDTTRNTVFIGSLMYMPERNETVNFAYEIRRFMKEHQTEGKDIYQYNSLGEFPIK